MTRLESFFDRIRRWLSPLWEGIANTFAWTLAGFIRLTLDALELAFAPMFRPIVDQAERTGKVPEALQGLLDEIKSPKSFGAAFLGQAAASGATGGLISSTIGPWLLLLQYEIQRAANQARWDPTTALAVWLRSPELRELAESDLRDGGWTQERFTGLLEAALTRLDPEDLVILRHRGLVTKEQFTKAMFDQGFTDERAEQFYAAREFYPSPNDLVRWQAREVFEPEMIARYGLDDELSDIEREPFYKAGMTDEQIRNYWRAHWEHASWTQVTEMLHRGQLTEQEVRDWFRLVEIPPFWRQKLINVSYNPLTRVDVRRMHKIGVLDRAGVKRAYLDVGFNDENAERMTEFTLRYNASEARELTRAEVDRLYKNQTITRVEAEERLSDLGYTAEDIALILDSSNVVTLERSRALTVSNLKSLYQLGLRPKAQVTNELAGLNYDAESIEALYDLWDYEKPASTRLPSRTDLDRFVAAGIIGLQTWSDQYSLLGYDEKYQEWYFAYLVETGKIE